MTKKKTIKKIFDEAACCCCSHIYSSPQYNAVRGRRTGSNNSGVEEYPVCMYVGVFRRYNAVRGRRTDSNTSGVEEYLVCIYVCMCIQTNHSLHLNETCDEALQSARRYVCVFRRLDGNSELPQ